MQPSPCLECSRLAHDYEKRVVGHSHFVAEYQAAILARDRHKIWELKCAVMGSDTLCRRAGKKLSAHHETHNQAAAWERPSWQAGLCPLAEQPEHHPGQA